MQSASGNTPTPSDLSARLLPLAELLNRDSATFLRGAGREHASNIRAAIAALSALPAAGGEVAEGWMHFGFHGQRVACHPAIADRVQRALLREVMEGIEQREATTPQPSAAEGDPCIECGADHGQPCFDGCCCKPDAAVGAQGDGDDNAARIYIRDWCPDHVKDYIARLAAPAAGKGVDDAALGRAYRRWYGAAKGYKDVDADAAHDFITREAALTRQPVAGDGK